MDDVPIPHVEAVPRQELPPPPQLNEGVGAVRYVQFKGRAKCEDCMQLIYEANMADRPANPSVANVARYRRIRGKTGAPRLICIEHHHARAEQEVIDGKSK